jgi:hypothetical protein
MKKMNYKNDEKAKKGKNIVPGDAYKVTESYTEVGKTVRVATPGKASDSYTG